MLRLLKRHPALLPLISLLLLAGCGSSSNPSPAPPKQVAVPNVVGAAQSSAATSLTTAGLALGAVTTQSSSTVSSGLVISENPAAGTEVNSGSAVSLVVSSGPAQLAVPNVVNQTRANATASLIDAGLALGTVTTQISATVAAGLVISEMPTAGTQVNAGSAVNLVVSSGSAEVATPDVVDQTQAAATTAIISANLTLGTIVMQPSDTVPSGSVVSQTPAAGVEVGAGSAVNLIVSSGPGPLNAADINLIFVVSGDLVYAAPGDIDAQTASLTSQGLGRSLSMATYLQQSVLGTQNVSGIYALEPMTHLQTSTNYPDMAALETVEQFALLNQMTLQSSASGGSPLTANSYPINASYAVSPITLPSGVATPLPYCQSCQGLDFTDQQGDNEALVNGIVSANVPGFYVFSAPWETIDSLMANINQSNSYGLTVPSSFSGPNSIYAISIPPSGAPNLLTYNSNLKPAATYPQLPSAPKLTNSCSAKAFSISVTGGVGGAVVPAGINTNETLYMIRHAEAHPASSFDDGNYVCAGQWRALDLPNVLRGKISPTSLYALDPAQAISGSVDDAGNSHWSYVRPALTLEPYAIANNLPLNLTASVELNAQDPPALATHASDFFFTGGGLSSQTALMAWEHAHIPTTVDALLASYFPNGNAPTVPDWASNDYDSIWTVIIDGNGNLTINNSLCEGIVSSSLPATCPRF